MATRTGTSGNDTIAGTNSADTFNIGGSTTGPGNDAFDGANGSDTASYASNSATQALNLASNAAGTFNGADGVGGTDTLSNFEIVIGGAGNDTINAALHTTAINLQGGAGNNVLTGGAVADTISATAGNNVLSGGGGNDTITGGTGVDTLAGDAGDDSLLGGEGDDTISGGAGNDRLDGGGGQDAADYRTSTGNVAISYTNVTGAEYTATNDGLGGSDSMTGMDDFLGGAGDDVINTAGSSWMHRIEGNAGADSLVGGTGADTLVGGAGNDTLDGGAGNDIADYSASTASMNLAYNATLAGGAGFGGADGTGGTDTVRNVETILGGSAADTISASGSSTAMFLNGNAGDDVLTGGTGTDTLDGGAGFDTASYAASATAVNLAYNATLAGGAGFTGTDVLRNMEAILGGSAADTITAAGSSAAVRLDGGAGADALTGGGVNDTLIGGAGNDTLTAGAGTDTVSVGGNAADYTVAFGQDGVGAFALVTDNNAANGDDGTDRIYGAETLQFADGSRSLAATKPTVAFGDANGLVNASEAAGTPVTISGLAAGETAVVTFKSAAGAATATASFTGNGTVNANISGLGDGAVTITQVAVTNGGTTSTFIDPAPGASLTLDKTPPTAPTIGAVADNAGAVQGPLASGAPTDDATLALSGTAAAGATVQVLNGAAVLGSATADANGNWAYTTAGLADGAVSLTARTADAAGNTATSAAFAATLDTAAPAVASVAASGAGIAGGTGALNAGKAVAFTVNASEALTVTGTPTLTLSNGATATYTAGSGTNALSFTYTVGASDGNTADLAVSALNLPTGTAIRDAAGNAVTFNASTVGNPAGALRIDTAAPGTPASVSLASDTGVSGTDGITSVATIKGTAEAGSTVTLRVGAAVVGTGTADATTGAFSIAPAGLAQGANTVTVTATDAAGNASATPASLGFTLDSAAPSVASVAASGPGIAGGSGSLNEGKVVTFTVGASEALTVSGAPTLALSNGAAASFTGGSGTNALTFSYTVAAGQDTADLAVNGLNLPGGASVRDAAGNAVSFGGPVNPAGTLAVDTTAPSATTTVGLAQDTGAAGDGITSSPVLAGIATGYAGGDTITVRDNGEVVGTAAIGPNGAWSFAPSGGATADGGHSYTAAVTDAAGNSGAATATSPAATVVDSSADADVSVDLTDATASAGGASVAFDIAGLDAGSTASVTLTGSAGGSTTFAYTSNGTKTAGVSGLSGDVSAAVQVTDAAGNAAAGQGDTLLADPVCFYPGTLVATPAGGRAVETLRAGDLVLTADGEAKPIRWLGRQTVSTRFADPLRVLPIRIAAGALGENLPRRDLLVSPDHALLLDGALVQAGALVNGTTVRREAGVPEVFTYWHVELADHSLVLAEGVPAETFIDNVARLAFDNWDEHEAAGSEAPIAEMALPRAKSARQVPAATRRRLADRAALLLGKQTAAA